MVLPASPTSAWFSLRPLAPRAGPQRPETLRPQASRRLPAPAVGTGRGPGAQGSAPGPALLPDSAPWGPKSPRLGSLSRHVAVARPPDSVASAGSGGPWRPARCPEAPGRDPHDARGRGPQAGVGTAARTPVLWQVCPLSPGFCGVGSGVAPAESAPRSGASDWQGSRQRPSARCGSRVTRASAGCPAAAGGEDAPPGRPDPQAPHRARLGLTTHQGAGAAASGGRGAASALRRGRTCRRRRQAQGCGPFARRPWGQKPPARRESRGFRGPLLAVSGGRFWPAAWPHLAGPASAHGLVRAGGGARNARLCTCRRGARGSRPPRRRGAGAWTWLPGPAGRGRRLRPPAGCSRPGQRRRRARGPEPLSWEGRGASACARPRVRVPVCIRVCVCVCAHALVCPRVRPCVCVEQVLAMRTACSFNLVDARPHFVSGTVCPGKPWARGACRAASPSGDQPR